MPKAFIKIATVLVCAIIAGIGCVFLLPAAHSSPPAPWVWVADADALPDDGTPLRVAVAITDRDAWTRRPDRVLGNVFLRRVRGSDQVMALQSVTHYGSTVEYDKEACMFHDRRCWNFHFDMDGKCVERNPHSDLLKLDVRIRDGKVYINWEFPR